jgi:hypothetical protein
MSIERDFGEREREKEREGERIAWVIEDVKSKRKNV